MLKITIEIKEDKKDCNKAVVKLEPPKDYTKGSEIEITTTKVLFNQVSEVLKNIR